MQKAIMEPFVRLIKPKTLSIFTRRACPHCEKATSLLDKIEAPYHEHEVSKFKQDEMRHLDEISGIKTVPKVFVGMKCIGGNEELQQSWKKRVLYDWLKKEQIGFKETSETMDMATGKDASKDGNKGAQKDSKDTGSKDKKPADKKKNKEDTTTTSSADDAGHKDTSKKKNDSQVGNKEGGAAGKKKKNKEDTTTTSSADDAKHKTTSKKKDDSKTGKESQTGKDSQTDKKSGSAGGQQKGASGTKDEGPLRNLGVKHFESPDSHGKNTKDLAKEKLSASANQDGKIGTRQTDQPKKGMGLDTGKDNKDKFASSDAGNQGAKSSQKGGSGDKADSDHPLGLKRGAYPDEQTSNVNEKHPNKMGTLKGDLREPTNKTGKEGKEGKEGKKAVGNHGVDIGKGPSADHRVNHANEKGSKK